MFSADIQRLVRIFSPPSLLSPLWLATSVRRKPARHDVCAQPSSARGTTRLRTRYRKLLLLLAVRRQGRLLSWGHPLHALCDCHRHGGLRGPVRCARSRCSLAFLLSARCPLAREQALLAHANVFAALRRRTFCAALPILCRHASRTASHPVCHVAWPPSANARKPRVAL